MRIIQKTRRFADDQHSAKRLIRFSIFLLQQAFSGKKLLQFLRPAAGHEMAGLEFIQLLGLHAGVAGVSTAGGKAAAGLGVDGGHQFTLGFQALGLIVQIGGGDG